MNNTNRVKYGLAPEDIEKESLSSKKFRLGFNFVQIKAISKAYKALDKYDKKLRSRKTKKLRADLAIEESILLLAERIKKKSFLGKFCKSSVQNISSFNKEKFFVSNKNKIDDKKFYCLTYVANGKTIKERFQRQEIFAVENNFI